MNGYQNAVRWDDIYERSDRGHRQQGKRADVRRTRRELSVIRGAGGRSVERGMGAQAVIRGEPAAWDTAGTRSREADRSRRQARIQQRYRQRRRREAIRGFCFLAFIAALCMGILAGVRKIPELQHSGPRMTAETGQIGRSSDFTGAETEESEILRELLEKNEETFDYVVGYENRSEYIGKPIDLTRDFISGEVPLLMQWDRRWGYEAYGKEMIGLAGCGPLCLDMAYLYFTGDMEMNPRRMAEFAYDNGFYTESGTSWALWTEGAALLGLKGEELPLDESRMKAELDAGGLIVCSMRPGDFTTTGHFILIRSYDENGFYVNDPNRRSTSGKVWDYETLQYQIRNLWGLRKGS